MCDSWVLPELPKTSEVSEKIVTELNALTNGTERNSIEIEGQERSSNSESD